MIFTAAPPIAPIAIPNKQACPTAIGPLAKRLVRDLPSYANRAALKNSTRFQVPEMSQVIIASQPDLEPIKLSDPHQVPDPNLHQLFITTLERQTFNQKTTSFQQYHWLFLVRTHQGWKLSQSFTRISSYPRVNTITPPRESSQSIMGQAIKTWLRDCQAGGIRVSVD